jgi:large subunit ribosomal protein L10
MNRTEKQQAIEELKTLFSSAEAIILTNPVGIDVNSINAIRKQCRNEGVQFKLVKNTLAQRALLDSPKAPLADLFVGPCAVMLKPGDPVTPAKLVLEFAKKNKKFEIRGGFISGSVLNLAGVEQLSKMQTLPQLRASFLSLLKAPQTGFVGVNNALVTKFLRLLQARADQLDPSKAAEDSAA